MAAPRQRSRRNVTLTLLCLLLAAAAGFEWWRSQDSFSSLRFGGFSAMTTQGKLCLLYSNRTPVGTQRSVFHTVPYNTAGKRNGHADRLSRNEPPGSKHRTQTVCRSDHGESKNRQGTLYHAQGG